MRTLRILTASAPLALLAGVLAAFSGCGSSDDAPPANLDNPAIAESRNAREAFAKTEKKQTARRNSGRGSDPRG